MANAGISGLAVGVITTGGFLVYTGIKNVTIQDGLRQITRGQAITEGPQGRSDLSSPPGAALGGALGQAGVGAAPGTFPDLSPPHGGGSTGGTDKASLQATARVLLNSYGWGDQWDAFNNLVNGESGWRMDATNPGTSKAYGLGQFVASSGGLEGNKQKYYAYGGNPNTGVGQLTGMLNYIKKSYGSPAKAWAFWQRTDPRPYAGHWY